MQNDQNVYWAFSAAAQAVATFVAFVLAGYALVHGMLDAAAAVDETLVEIHEELKRSYHRQLSVLASVTAMAVVADLVVVYLNAAPPSWFRLLTAAAAILTVIAIAGGVAFVIRTVDPSKYRRAAEKLSIEARPQPETSAGRPSSEFFMEFVALERSVRALWESRTQGERLSRRSNPPSFGEMLELLRIAEIWPPNLYERLREINRYRNLVFHGQITEVAPSLIEDVRRVRAQVEGLSGGNR